MADTEATTPRLRYRAQVREEIKDHARQQIAAAGTSALSLNAIAKQMGLSGPALYRYYAGRDELITELIRDAYRSLADAVHQTAATQGADPRALAHALRRWALADPHRYLLIYGTPIPGYHAPADTTAISGKIMTVLLDAYVTLPRRPPTPLAIHLHDHRHWAAGHSASPEVLHRALTFWTRLHGVLSLELAGHFTAMGFDPAQLFAAEVDDLVRR
ncbi:TetR/AcrR family transcriptional regulator [Actinoalloteichus sp. GBA129-24]|uniref:TetR/AcrR family transcriptional regulator n=1 Tax=Actinoalloteichus sp. GBA129-24 TaxID=1612551 RepID=UPI0009504FEF|nr:TetR/AcrR family transcriptional regulator [Actinoalloteichus sp. GBA129-24]APU22609.1 transcriptional regulator, TetR family [Actinoalloteichus sp. GBA129-24]